MKAILKETEERKPLKRHNNKKKSDIHVKQYKLLNFEI